MGLLLHSALILWVVHRWEPGVVEKYRLRRLHLKVHQRPIHDADAFILHEGRSNGEMTCEPGVKSCGLELPGSLPRGVILQLC